MAGFPPAEIDIDERLVRGLLRSQHPDLAGLPVRLAATGWDNCTYRLGDDLAVRVPRIEAGAALVGREQVWLPRLAPGLPLPVPVPARVGLPDAGFPWPWSVVPWFPGRSAEHGLPAPDQAVVLGRFLAALHRPAPPDAPRNDWRGVPLTRVEGVEARLALLSDAGALPDAGRLAEVWQAALATPVDVPETLVHADLHPKNLVVGSGRLVAVLDWGDLTLGDPAIDLATAWMLFPAEAHAEFRRGYGPVTGPTAARARGWAVFFGTVLLEVGLAGDLPFEAIGRATLRRLTA